jgi:hypothetical protein
LAIVAIGAEGQPLGGVTALTVGALLIAAWVGSAAAQDYRSADCSASRVTIKADGETKCAQATYQYSNGPWASIWRVDYRGQGRYLAAFLTSLEASNNHFTMGSIGDAALASLAKQMKAVAVGESRSLSGVSQLPFTVKGGSCAAWINGTATASRGGGFTSFIYGVFCVPQNETLTDELFELFLSEVQVEGKALRAPPD